METFVIIKRPGEPAALLPAPARVNLDFLAPLIGGYIEILPKRALPPDVLRDTTVIVNEEGELRGLAPNLQFASNTILGPVVVTLTNEEGDDHGLCREHAQALAKALDRYAVR